MLSTKTVEFHLSNIYTKIGVRTPLRAARPGARERARALTAAVAGALKLRGPEPISCVLAVRAARRWP